MIIIIIIIMEPYYFLCIEKTPVFLSIWDTHKQGRLPQPDRSAEGVYIAGVWGACHQQGPGAAPRWGLNPSQGSKGEAPGYFFCIFKHSICKEIITKVANWSILNMPLQKLKVYVLQHCRHNHNPLFINDVIKFKGIK